MAAEFVHLHVHSQYSFLTSAVKLSDLPGKAKGLGMRGVGLTDVANMYGAIRHYKGCKEKGITPILGCEVFVPRTGSGGMVFYVRSAIGSTALYGQLRNEVRHIDNAMPMFAMKTLERQLDETLLTDRLVALLAAGFGLLAATLASIGLYGVMAFVVARRRKELGIRLALGSTRGGVIWIVMREVLTLLANGLVVGVPAALGLLTYVSSKADIQLYGVQAHDPLVGGLTALLLITVTVLAGLIPAQRASRINPITALRYE